MGESSQRQGDATPDSPRGDSGLFFSQENTAQIGRFTIPFPFSAIVGILALPLLLIGGALSVPYTAVRNFVVARREEKHRRAMELAGRTIAWQDALSAVHQAQGTFVEEYFSFKGPYRLWFTAENVAQTSPFPCVFEELPWFHDCHEAFFEWTRARFTDVGGNAKLVGIQNVPPGTIRKALAEERQSQRCVSIANLPRSR